MSRIDKFTEMLAKITYAVSFLGIATGIPFYMIGGTLATFTPYILLSTLTFSFLSLMTVIFISSL